MCVIIKNTFFLILLLFLSCCSDNKSQEIKQTFWSVEKFNLLTTEQKKVFLDSVRIIVDKEKADSLKIDNYLEIALEYYYINEMELSNSASRTALAYARNLKDSSAIGRALFYIGDSFKTTEKDSAYFYYHQAEKLYDIKQDQVNIARMQLSKGFVLFQDGNYIACEVQLSKALKNLKNSDDYYLLYSCNSLLGNCLEKIGDYDEALIYHKYALENISNLKINSRERNAYIVSTTINISNLYDIKEEYRKSIINLHGIFNENLRKTSPLSYARVLSNLAYSKFKNKEYEGVESMFLESLRIADRLGQDSDLLYKYTYLGEFYSSQKDTARAIFYIKLANDLASRHNNTNELLNTYKLLAKIDKANSLKYLSEYIKISDNAQALQKKTRNKYARIEYETTKIQDANKTLSRNNIIIITAAIVLFTLLITIGIARYIKYKNKELQFLRKQERASEDIFNLLTEQQQKINHAKETEKTKIAQELHDGVINSLYGIRLNLDFFNSKKDLEAIEKRKNYIDELKKVEADIRSISHDLSRNTFFDNSDFSMLIEGLIESQKGISTTRFSYINIDDSNWGNVSNLCKINLYRIVQEAVLNVNKYAQAQNCIISFQKKNNTIRLLIQDDGIGFDTGAKRNGIGHNNMNSRIKSLDGQIHFTSEAGKGTTIEIIVDTTIAQVTNYKLIKL